MRQPPTLSAVEILERHWAKQASLKRCVAASPDEISAFETKHGVSLPSDFREYIAHLNGTPTHPDPESWDGVEAGGFEFYSLAALYPMPDAYGYFVFCSWVIGLLPFAICLNQQGRHGEVIASRDGLSGSYLVAPSFTSFATLYVEDSTQIYGSVDTDAQGANDGLGS
ncbi:MAG: SMI1/KNR4 family protein [Pseudomonadota bacterium]